MLLEPVTGSDVASSTEESLAEQETTKDESAAEQMESNNNCGVELNASQMSCEEYTAAGECSTSELLSQTQEVLESVSPDSPQLGRYGKPSFQLPEESNCSQQLLAQDIVNPNQHVAYNQQLEVPMRPSLPRRYSSPISTGHDHLAHPPMTRSLSDQLPYHMRRSFTGRLGSPCSGSEMVSVFFHRSLISPCINY